MLRIPFWHRVLQYKVFQSVPWNKDKWKLYREPAHHLLPFPTCHSAAKWYPCVCHKPQLYLSLLLILINVQSDPFLGQADMLPYKTITDGVKFSWGSEYIRQGRTCKTGARKLASTQNVKLNAKKIFLTSRAAEQWNLQK